MRSDPISNDIHNPLISIFIHNYDGKYLRQCLDSIFDQTILDNIEVVYLDDASTDGAWDIALEFLDKYPNIITMSRNRKSIGPSDNFLNLLKGKYYVPLCHNAAFLPEYTKQCVQAMEFDPLAEFIRVRNFKRDSIYLNTVNVKPLTNLRHLPAINKKPLVSITIHNYNYGRYLRQCLESVFSQTYDNIEVCFSDNASTDESWSIALEYAGKFPDKISVTRNRQNFGSDANYLNAWVNVSGKYLVTMCSDDAFMPEFVERCVEQLEAHPDAGFAMVHRTVLDEHGNRTDEAPFYNESCVIPGHEQAAVYMLAAVNPSISQVMYRISSIYGKSNPGSLAARWYGNRILDFNLCCEYDMVYLKDPLLMHRLHSQNDSFFATENLIEVIAPYVLQHQLAETASNCNLTKVASRLPQAIEKLSHLCLRYSVRSLCLCNETAARRYFHLAIAIMPAIMSDPTFKTLETYWMSDAAVQCEIVDSLSKTDNLVTRAVSYDPPSGSVSIE